MEHIKLSQKQSYQAIFMWLAENHIDNCKCGWCRERRIASIPTTEELKEQAINEYLNTTNET